MSHIGAGLRWASNMGHLDVFPSTSGKDQVAKYLLRRMDGDASNSFLLCDDANDMGAFRNPNTRDKVHASKRH